MFGFIKNVFFTAISFLINWNALNANALACVSMNNQECKVRSGVIDIDSNKPSFYSYSIEINKCSSSCNSINDPYAKLCVPDAVKNKMSKCLI